MKQLFAITLGGVFTALSLSAWAHDPSQHTTATTAPPDCSSMQDMDPNTRAEDPLTNALYAQCKDYLSSARPGHDAAPGQPPTPEATR